MQLIEDQEVVAAEDIVEACSLSLLHRLQQDAIPVKVLQLLTIASLLLLRTLQGWRNGYLSITLHVRTSARIAALNKWSCRD